MRGDFSDALAEVLGDEAEVASVDLEDLPTVDRIAVVERQEFAFDCDLGAVQRIPVCLDVDATKWVSAEMLVLIHAAQDWDPGSVLYVIASAIDFDSLDPSVEFVGDQLGMIKHFGSDGAPYFHLGSVQIPWGRYLKVSLEWRPGDKFGRTCTLSIYLLGRLHRLAASEAER